MTDDIASGYGVGKTSRTSKDSIQQDMFSEGLNKKKCVGNPAEVQAFSDAPIAIRPYQEESIVESLEAWERGICRQVVSMATGGGKTICFSLLAQRFLDRLKAKGVPRKKRKVLILAHREELVRQNAEKFKWVNPDLKVQIEQGPLHAELDTDIISGCVATMGRNGSSRIHRFDPSDFCMVIVDEVHHAASDSYKRILHDFFHTNDPDSTLFVSGWSATVKRSDGKGLEDVFDEIVYHKGILSLINEGYLTRLRGKLISTDVDLSSVGNVMGDFNQGQLGATVNTPHRNSMMVKAWEEEVRDAGRKSTMVFCVDREHAAAVRDLFQASGIPTEMVLGNTPKEERERILNDFSAGHLAVLVSVLVYTEGTDIPCIDTIIMGRPTQSSSLYQQIMGRGLRLFPGKEDCLVLDVVDTCSKNSLVTVPALMGLNKDFDAKGEDMVVIAEKVQAMADRNAGVVNALDMAHAERIIAEDFDPFSTMPPPDEIQRMSEMKWFQVGENRYRTDIKGLDLKKNHVEIRQDGIGHWEVAHGVPGKEEKVVGRRDELMMAFLAADTFLRETYPSSIPLMAKYQDWHDDPISPKQTGFLKKLGVPIPEGLTKGEARDLIEETLRNQQGGRRQGGKLVPRIEAVAVGKI